MTTQIAVKLPDDLVEGIDSLVSKGVFASRSAAVRRGLEVVLSAQNRAAIDQAFKDGYRTIPETDRELAEAERLALEAIADEPWEKWW